MGHPLISSSDTDDAAYYKTGSVESEEVETEVDRIVSETGRLLKVDQDVSSLTDLLKEMFGDDEEMENMSITFLEAINGYNDFIFGEGLEEARHQLHGLIDHIEKKVAQWQPKKS